MKGHKTKSLEHNGERSRAESAWTWTCECGAQESASTRDETQRERAHHLKRYRSPQDALSEAQETALAAVEDGPNALDDKARPATVRHLLRRSMIRLQTGQTDVFEITSYGRTALEDCRAAQTWRRED